MHEALASLLAAAALVGPPAPPVAAPRAASARNAAGETIVAEATVAAVAAAQSGAFVSRPLGAETLEAAAAFDAEGNLWIKLRSGGRRAAYPASALTAGVDAELPSGKVALKLAGGVLRAAGANGAAAAFAQKELLDALYGAAARFQLSVVAYAALSEDGAEVPASLCLLRRDADGNYFVTYRAPEEMRQKTQWIMATGGELYGMKLDGLQLVFVSKPLPPAR